MGRTDGREAGATPPSTDAARPEPAVPDDIRRMLDGWPDAAVAVDAERRVLYRNAAYDAYTGLKPRALKLALGEGRCCHELFRLEICATSCLVQRAAEAGKAMRMDEVRARRGDGEEVTLIVTATPLAGGLVVETYRDVTVEARVQRRYHALLARERQMTETLERAVAARSHELERAQEQLVQSEKLSSLGRLVAGIAHELNNPINFVYGNVDFLADYLRELLALVELYESQPLGDDLRARVEAWKRRVDFDFMRRDWERLVRSVRSGAERAAHIVAELKTYSSPQLGRIEEVDLVDGLDTTLHLLGPMLRGRREPVTIVRELAPLPLVRCRSGQVQQVLMNLLTNAIEACGPSGGTVRVRARPSEGGVEIAVKDSGPGVPDEVRGKIFDPFFTTKDVGEGTGLGLAISSRIVKAHNGRLDLVSPPGEGAEFVLWLPVAPPAG